MAYLLDTDVVIHLRDGDQAIWARIYDIEPPLHISAMTRVELENGVYRDRKWQSERRTALDLILTQISTIALTEATIASYRGILETAMYSKRKVSDRLTAATALLHGLTLITMNGRDFRDVAGLTVLDWPAPR